MGASSVVERLGSSVHYVLNFQRELRNKYFGANLNTVGGMVTYSAGVARLQFDWSELSELLAPPGKGLKK